MTDGRTHTRMPQYRALSAKFSFSLAGLSCAMLSQPFSFSLAELSNCTKDLIDIVERNEYEGVCQQQKKVVYENGEIKLILRVAENFAKQESEHPADVQRKVKQKKSEQLQ